jgi:GTP-binding protein
MSIRKSAPPRSRRRGGEWDPFDVKTPIVAIVGRPNVGKSTLFNRLTGSRDAVVHDTPGVTRDRHYGLAEWLGRSFRLVDTGGFMDETDRATLLPEMREQALMAINEADAVVFLLDAAELDNPLDQMIADILRKGSKPSIAAVNKCEGMRQEHAAWELAKLGLGAVYPISALHGNGTGEMLDALVDILPPKEEVWEEEDDFEDADEDAKKAAEDAERPIRLAIVGRQNAGKSTLVNRLLGEERMIASPVPGTTRDSIDTGYIAPDGQRWILIDTAGLRRRGKMGSGVEGIVVLSALMSMERADVALLLVDAVEGVTDQDKHIAGYAVDRGCCLIIGVNKWDIAEKDHKTADQFVKTLHKEFPFVEFAPVLFLSALTGQRATKVWELAKEVYAEATRRIETSRLNAWLQKATGRFPPPVRKNRQLKANYVVQTGVLPPTFAVFCNDPKLAHFSYQRYLINSLREEFEMRQTPLRLKFRRKSPERGEEGAGGSRRPRGRK